MRCRQGLRLGASLPSQARAFRPPCALALTLKCPPARPPARPAGQPEASQRRKASTRGGGGGRGCDAGCRHAQQRGWGGQRALTSKDALKLPSAPPLRARSPSTAASWTRGRASCSKSSARVGGAVWARAARGGGWPRARGCPAAALAAMRRPPVCPPPCLRRSRPGVCPAGLRRIWAASVWLVQARVPGGVRGGFPLVQAVPLLGVLKRYRFNLQKACARRPRSHADRQCGRLKERARHASEPAAAVQPTACILRCRRWPKRSTICTRAIARIWTVSGSLLELPLQYGLRSCRRPTWLVPARPRVPPTPALLAAPPPAPPQSSPPTCCSPAGAWQSSATSGCRACRRVPGRRPCAGGRAAAGLGCRGRCTGPGRVLTTLPLTHLACPPLPADAHCDV